jgi:hypothetical protein
MAQIAEQDVKKALRDLGEESDGMDGGPLLLPEQVDRITAIAHEKDPLAKGQKTSAMIEQLLKDAESGSERLAQIHRRLGLDASQNKAFLEGNRLSDQAKQRVQGELQAFKKQVMEEVDREAKHAANGSKARTGRTPRPGRLTV